jgi:hypothetical protein
MDTQQQIEELKKEIAELRQQFTLTYRQHLRLKNALLGDKVFYVASSSGGSPTVKLTFKDGILTLDA